ncbi:MAG: penicillin acylase family protein [Pseudomonadales bacterium]
MRDGPARRRTLFLYHRIHPRLHRYAPLPSGGSGKPAEILVDNYGIPHIYAGTHYDAFFVQGFNAARSAVADRSVAATGLGQLAEVLGEKYVAQDRAARLFLYRGDMYRKGLAYGSDAKRIAQAFTAGINAYVDLLTPNWRCCHRSLRCSTIARPDGRPKTWYASAAMD